MPSCSCCRCVDLYCDRNSGTTYYAIELPLFRGSITLRASTWKSSNNPAHAHRRWIAAIFRTITGITSVPECAVSSVGFLWGSATVSRTCGIPVGLSEAPDPPGRTFTGQPVPQLPDADDLPWGNPELRTCLPAREVIPRRRIWLPVRFDALKQALVVMGTRRTRRASAARCDLRRRCREGLTLSAHAGGHYHRPPRPVGPGTKGG